MNEYYSQYIEEYYEEPEFGQEPDTPPARYREKERVIASTLSEIVEVLRDAKAVDIAVFSREERRDDDEGSGAPFTIICSPLNSRHGRSIAAALSDSAKASEGEGTRAMARRASNWYVVHVRDADTTVHIMDEEMRARFDLESMLSGAEEGEEGAQDDEIPDIPPLRPRKYL